ncbi:MAG: PPOX class F420-dependent oxidoreductase [Streptomycetaceae bacterium]|jgi:pyridoxamine 5'-phosphate oxidase family protein|nr:PPOX class F420-dependent oxidoreductase [Streptomycetaceae bacterium]
MTSTSPFTPAELEYLRTQRLGRLATAAPDGTLQNNPVGFTVDTALGTIDIAGYAMGASRKFRNVEQTHEVAFVVDDIASVTPWKVRGIEIRGTAEAVREAAPRRPGLSAEIIRVHPRRILSWGLDPDADGMQRRSITTTTA